MKRVHPQKMHRPRKRKAIRKQDKFRRSAERQENKEKARFYGRVFRENLAWKNECFAEEARMRRLKEMGLDPYGSLGAHELAILAALTAQSEQRERERQIGQAVQEALYAGKVVTVNTSGDVTTCEPTAYTDGTVVIVSPRVSF